MRLSTTATSGYPSPVAVPSLFNSSRTFAAFSTLTPGTTNAIAASVGGAPCSGGLQLGATAGFTTSTLPASSVSGVLRTTTVYADYPVLSIAFVLRDADGRTRVTRPDSLSVSGVTQTGAAGCSVSSIDADTGVGFCNVVVATSEFPTSGPATVSRSVTLSVMYGSAAGATTVLSATLAQAVPAVTLSSGTLGMLVQLPKSPRLPTEQFTVTAQGYSGTKPIAFFQITLYFNQSVVTYIGDSDVTSTLYELKKAVTNAASTSEMAFLSVIGTAKDNTASTIVGDAVPLLVAKFAVASGATAGAVPRAFTGTVVSFTDVSNTNFLLVRDAMFADSRGSAGVNGLLTVWTADPVGLLAYASVPEVFNVHPLNGATTSSTVQARIVKRSICSTTSGCASAGDSAGNVVSTCSASGASNVGTLSGCTFTVGGAATTSGSQAVSITATSGALTAAAVTVRVWHPTSVSVTAGSSALQRVAGARTASCGGVFQSTPLAVTATFGGSGLTSVTVDVTCLSTLVSSNPSVVSVAGGLATGVAPGTAAISVGAASVTIAVLSNSTVTPVCLSAALVLGSAVFTPSSVPTQTQSATSSVSMSASYAKNDEQSLTSEGSGGSIVAFARLSDGSYLEVLPSLGLQVVASADFRTVLNSSTLSVSNTNYYRAFVMNNAGNAASSCALEARWVDACSSGAGSLLAAGPIGARVQLPSASSASVSISSSTPCSTPSATCSITRSGDSAERLGRRTSAQLSVSVTFPGQGAVSFTNDPRTVYSVVSGSNLVSVSSSGLVTPVSGTTFGAAVVNVTFPSYSRAASVWASITIRVDGVTGITWSASPFPSYTGSSSVAKTTLRRVHCTTAYQRAVVSASVTLSDSTTADVSSNTFLSVASSATDVVPTPTVTGSRFILTGSRAGTSNVAFSFGSGITSSAAITVTDTPATVSSLTWPTSFWQSASSPVTFAAVLGATQTTVVSVTFSDGTQFPDAISGVSWVPPSDYLSFASDDSDVISISASGVATIHASSYRVPVTLTASAASCSSSTAVSGTTQVYANLEPAVGDIDLGSQFGLPFSASPFTSPPSVGQQISVPMRVNLGTGRKLTFVSMVMLYPSSWLTLQSISYNLPSAYTAGNVNWCNTGTAGELRCGVSAGFAPELLSDQTRVIATVTFTVHSATVGAGLFEMDQYSCGLATSSTSQTQYPQNGGVATAGPGPVSFNNGVLPSGRRRSVLIVDEESAALEKRQASACSTCRSASAAAQCAAGQCTARCFGDTNADCVFNGGDVSYLQTILLNRPVTPAYNTITAWQLRQLTPLFYFYDSAFDRNLCTGGTYVDAVTPCPTNNDAIQLTYILAGYSLFLNLTRPSDLISSSTGGGFTLTAPFYDQNGVSCSTSSCAAISSAVVKYEFNVSGLTYSVANASGAVATATGREMVSAVRAAGGYTVSVAAPFSSTSIGVTVLLSTYPQQQTAQQSNKAFFASPVFGGNSYRPFVGVAVTAGTSSTGTTGTTSTGTTGTVYPVSSTGSTSTGTTSTGTTSTGTTGTTGSTGTTSTGTTGTIYPVSSTGSTSTGTTSTGTTSTGTTGTSSTGTTGTVYPVTSTGSTSTGTTSTGTTSTGTTGTSSTGTTGTVYPVSSTGSTSTGTTSTGTTSTGTTGTSSTGTTGTVYPVGSTGSTSTGTTSTGTTSTGTTGTTSTGSTGTIYPVSSTGSTSTGTTSTGTTSTGTTGTTSTGSSGTIYPVGSTGSTSTGTTSTGTTSTGSSGTLYPVSSTGSTSTGTTSTGTTSTGTTSSGTTSTGTSGTSSTGTTGTIYPVSSTGSTSTGTTSTGTTSTGTTSTGTTSTGTTSTGTTGTSSTGTTGTVYPVSSTGSTSTGTTSTGTTSTGTTSTGTTSSGTTSTGTSGTIYPVSSTGSTSTGTTSTGTTSTGTTGIPATTGEQSTLLPGAAPLPNVTAIPGGAFITWSRDSSIFRKRVVGPTTLALLEMANSTDIFSTIGIYNATSFTHNQTGLTPGETYKFRVFMRNSAGDGPPSTAVMVVPLPVPVGSSSGGNTAGNTGSNSGSGAVSSGSNAINEETTTTTTTSGSDSMLPIIAGAIGGVCCCIVVLVVFIVWRRRRLARVAAVNHETNVFIETSSGDSPVGSSAFSGGSSPKSPHLSRPVAATRIQSSWRGFAVRKPLWIAREDDPSVVVIAPKDPRARLVHVTPDTSSDGSGSTDPSPRSRELAAKKAAPTSTEEKRKRATEAAQAAAKAANAAALAANAATAAANAAVAAAAALSLPSAPNTARGAPHTARGMPMSARGPPSARMQSGSVVEVVASAPPPPPPEPEHAVSAAAKAAPEAEQRSAKKGDFFANRIRAARAREAKKSGSITRVKSSQGRRGAQLMTIQADDDDDEFEDLTSYLDKTRGGAIDMEMIRTEAAVLIQRGWRKFRFNQHLKREMAAIKIQRFIKRALSKRHSKQDKLQHLLTLAKKRAHDANRSLANAEMDRMQKETLDRLKSSNSKGQEQLEMERRQKALRRKVRKSKAEQRQVDDVQQAAAIVLQTWWRRVLLRRGGKRQQADAPLPQGVDPRDAEAVRNAKMRALQERLGIREGAQQQKAKLQSTLNEWLKKDIAPSVQKLHNLRAEAAKREKKSRSQGGSSGNSSGSASRLTSRSNSTAALDYDGTPTHGRYSRRSRTVALSGSGDGSSGALGISSSELNINADTSSQADGSRPDSAATGGSGSGSARPGSARPGSARPGSGGRHRRGRSEAALNDADAVGITQEASVVVSSTDLLADDQE